MKNFCVKTIEQLTTVNETKTNVIAETEEEAYEIVQGLVISDPETNSNYTFEICESPDSE